MAKCGGCAGDRCSCVIEAGENITVSGAGTSNDPYVVTGQGDGGSGGSGGGLPPGIIAPFAGVTPPAGWLICNGGSISRSSYAALFAVIGTTYGAGDGSTTFGLPNMTGRFPLATSGPHPLAQTGGAETVTLQPTEIPGHTHSLSNHQHPISHDHGQAWTSGFNANHSHAFSGGTGVSGGHEHFQNTANNVTGFGNNSPAQGNKPNNDQRSTTGGGGHSHAFSGGTDWANADHAHIASVPALTGWSGGVNVDSTGANSGGGAHNNMPPFMALTFLIKT